MRQGLSAQAQHGAPQERAASEDESALRALREDRGQFGHARQALSSRVRRPGERFTEQVANTVLGVGLTNSLKKAASEEPYIYMITSSKNQSFRGHLLECIMKTYDLHIFVPCSVWFLMTMYLKVHILF